MMEVCKDRCQVGPTVSIYVFVAKGKAALALLPKLRTYRRQLLGEENEKNGGEISSSV